MTTPSSPEQAPAVGYLGPEGTFTEEALLSSAVPEEVRPHALSSIADTVSALKEGVVRWAIVPIENSLDGSVSVTLDLLAAEDSAVRIVGEAQLRVRHALIAPAGLAVADVRTVLTHPQVPGQCRRFISEQLAGASFVPTASTAEAVRIVAAERGLARAAIGTSLAAGIYGAEVLCEEIEDREDNETRFAWLARTGEPQTPPLRRSDGHAKTSLVFWGSGAARAGWLVRCLDEFARREINLTKIESRPRRGRMGSYMFFADLLGDAGERPAHDAIAGLGQLCEEVRVLGSYPAAAAAVLPPGPTDGTAARLGR